MNLILASQSPRRRTLLEQFGFQFQVDVLPVDEMQSGDPLETARANAIAKAKPVSIRHPQALVLGADTIVVLDGRILGKPTDAEDAARMLRALSGREHEVTTVVALLRNGQEERVFSETTKVQFRRLTEAEIAGYVATGEPLDKAGSYGIQGLGGLLVQSIKGCYYNVVGLPIPRLAEELRPYGIEVFPSR
ncbi:MAG: septum formation inhibitor Maf [Firmicutes bacterium]|nr:septum formation inhibitor Maf [Bacillota bacterium]